MIDRTNTLIQTAFRAVNNYKNNHLQTEMRLHLTTESLQRNAREQCMAVRGYIFFLNFCPQEVTLRSNFRLPRV